MTDTMAVELTGFAEGLADQSRAMLLDTVGKRPEVDIKADASFVTETDRAIETRLREVIEQAYPDHGVLGEEHGSRDLDAEFVWVLDPIDGTAPFIAGIPVYGTLIGIARGGRPWVGVIDHPATDDRWVGVSDSFARHNGTAIDTMRGTSLADAFMTNSNPDFFNEDELRAFTRLRQAVRYTQYGGSCFAYGVLASGRTDLAVDGGLDPFDIFAPAAVIAGAGGVVTDWSGHEIDLTWQGRVIAAGDQNLHAQALPLLATGSLKD
ncbi:MAG: inositol monophosphatase family protein [Aestuariivirgaceae bacterium]